MWVTQRRVGIFQVLLSGFCFGFLGVLGKSAYQKGLTPGELLSLRFTIGGVLLALGYAVRNPERLRLTRRQLASCAWLGVLGYAVFSSCFFQALTGLSVSLTVLLLYTYPVMVALGAWMLFGERMAKGRWSALPIAMVGLVLLVWGDMQVSRPVSLMFGIASAVFYSAYILASSRWLKGVDAGAAAVYIQLSAGLALGAVHLRNPERVGEILVVAWPTLLAIALVCSVAAMSLFLAGLQKLKSWEVSILSTAEPVTGIGLAVLLMGERLTAMQGAGAALVLAAFLLVAWPSKG